MVTGRVPFEASTPSEVMRKHLKEPLVPPDHINIALTAGISEVIEVMMTKNVKDRYNSMEELLIDLKAIQEGRAPLQARQKFNIDALEQLEEGRPVDIHASDETLYTEETITKYRVGLVDRVEKQRHERQSSLLAPQWKSGESTQSSKTSKRVSSLSQVRFDPPSKRLQSHPQDHGWIRPPVCQVRERAPPFQHSEVSLVNSPCLHTEFRCVLGRKNGGVGRKLERGRRSVGLSESGL